MAKIIIIGKNYNNYSCMLSSSTLAIIREKNIPKYFEN